METIQDRLLGPQGTKINFYGCLCIVMEGFVFNWKMLVIFGKVVLYHLIQESSRRCFACKILFLVHTYGNPCSGKMVLRLPVSFIVSISFTSSSPENVHPSCMGFLFKLSLAWFLKSNCNNTYLNSSLSWTGSGKVSSACFCFPALSPGDRWFYLYGHFELIFFCLCNATPLLVPESKIHDTFGLYVHYVLNIEHSRKWLFTMWINVHTHSNSCSQICRVKYTQGTNSLLYITTSKIITKETHIEAAWVLLLIIPGTFIFCH